MTLFQTPDPGMSRSEALGYFALLTAAVAATLSIARLLARLLKRAR